MLTAHDASTGPHPLAVSPPPAPLSATTAAPSTPPEQLAQKPTARGSRPLTELLTTPFSQEQRMYAADSSQPAAAAPHACKTILAVDRPRFADRRRRRRGSGAPAGSRVEQRWEHAARRAIFARARARVVPRAGTHSARSRPPLDAPPFHYASSGNPDGFLRASGWGEALWGTRRRRRRRAKGGVI
ncbi:hypothetical protein K488DRAFT_91063 [Vararia minispora EC-137]|uniref:Uncharacterized protein n=1 Tax=Vararia minispora EC-137 TaxID=1314806 RepID=A0ACB8Q6K5_9AGAM|nr:hypothetical protein K488DRAFT_91063 [Vararia minispora EC-137]